MEYLIYDVMDRVATITINRPEKRNAFSHELVIELKEAFRWASEDKQVRAIILKANGKVFSAGADLAFLQTLQSASYEENLQDSTSLKELYYQIYTHAKPVIAQVQGHAIAGGCGLVTVCDMVFAIPEAKFGYTEVKIGFVPAIVMTFLLRKVGEAHAKSLLLSGQLVSASKMYQLGLVNEIVEPSKLEERVTDFVQNLISEASGEAIERTKKLIAEIQEKTLVEALHMAARANAKARETVDCKQGIYAFLNKEKVKW